jgi:hypothetical protein
MPAASVPNPTTKKKIDKNYPMPDPCWPYAQHYHNLYAAKFELEEIILYISRFEEKSSEIDQNLEKRLSDLAKKITQAIYIE